MNHAIQIEDGEWFCLGNIIQKNDHPKLLPYVSWPLDGVEAGTGHYSFSEAKEHCKANPCLTPTETLQDFAAAYYKRPKIWDGKYMGVQWSYSADLHCYACDLAEDIPFSSLRQVKSYIKDWRETVGYDD